MWYCLIRFVQNHYKERHYRVWVKRTNCVDALVDILEKYSAM